MPLISNVYKPPMFPHQQYEDRIVAFVDVLGFKDLVMQSQSDNKVLLNITSALLAITKHLNFFYLVATFFVLHLSYGWGSLMGILKLPFVK